MIMVGAAAGTRSGAVWLAARVGSPGMRGPATERRAWAVLVGYLLIALGWRWRGSDEAAGVGRDGGKRE
jgi:hypothetical protein